MKFSIATVSIGGSLTEKLAAIAAAGFDGVEIFEADVLAHEGSPGEIGALVRDHGLEIVAFQPFRDFEGMPEPQRARGFERAKRKFELMNELGAGRDPHLLQRLARLSLGGIDRAAADLRELGEVAEGFGIDIGFEALAWGRHVSDYRDAWEIVRRADHPRVGLILDSWHSLARGLPCDPIRAIPADRITFVQLADAPRMEMDLLQWSRHFRNFPGQGDLPVDDFMACGRCDRLRRLALPRDLQRPLPHGLAAADRRGRRAVADLARRPDAAGRMPPRAVPEAVEWIEFAVSEDDAAELARLFAGLGFAADRAAPLEAGDALTPRARSTSSSTPSPRGSRTRTRSCTGPRWWRSGSGSAMPARRWRGPRRCGSRLPPAGGAGRARHPGDPRARGVAHLLHRRGVGSRAGLGDRVRAGRGGAGRAARPASTTSRSR